MKIERIEKIVNTMKDSEGKVLSNKLIERLNSISFWELLTETTKIQIPIIQRDYAQGRENGKTNKIRALFLKSIINAVESENGSVELDFVYGNVEKNIFQPLDGQQRLTTLFLLHWFIALKTGDLQNFKSNFLKFTYETRISSREFCNELVENGQSLGEGKTISEKISDSKWFFLSWEKDPTIKAMLIMLDSIEERIKGKKDKELKVFWQKLTSDNPPITFYYKKLNDIGLTDDLYIKMNARGKALTDFESFKAKFEQYINKVIYKTNENGEEILEKGEKVLLKDDWEKDLKNIEETFSHKIDTVWTDLFWKHRGVDNQIDNEIIKFIAGIAINSYAQFFEIYNNEEEDQNTKKILEEKKEKNITAEAIKSERIERRITTLFNNPEDINPDDFPTKDTFEYLKNCLDVYTKNQNDELFPSNLPFWDFIENKNVKIDGDREIANNIFIEFIKDQRTEYKQRVLFYAQTQFLLSTEIFNADSFSEWMRVVRNIVQNSQIDSSRAFMGAIGLINELSKGCTEIYDYLKNSKIKSSFASSQIAEEILKSKIITSSTMNSKNIIFKTEDINFFKGKIKFALYCINVQNELDDFDPLYLTEIQKVIKQHLSSNEISNDFRRALFCIKNNDFYNYWGTWSYGTNSNKKCLIENTSDLRNNFTSGYYADYLKDILRYLVDSSLFEIIENFICPEMMPNWKIRLIKEPQLLENFCQAHYFGIPNDNSSCYLFGYKKRPSSKEECIEIA